MESKSSDYFLQTKQNVIKIIYFMTA